MKAQYSHSLVSSFVSYLDSQIGQQGGYSNVTGSLFFMPQSGVVGNVYSSPYRSWVWDSCAGGATIPSGFYNSSGQFLTRSSGLVLDFVNGRVITPNNWGPTLTGVYARKEVNVYYSDLNNAEYILERVYNENRNMAYTYTGLDGGVLTAPMMIVTNAKGYNDPWALGGLQNSRNTVRGFLITDSNYLQDGVNSLCQDLKYKTVPFIDGSQLPITASGDLKNPPTWSYCTDVVDAVGCTGGLYIEGVYFYKMSEKSNKNHTFYISIMDFDTMMPRIPN